MKPKDMAEIGKILAGLERHLVGTLAQLRELRLVVHRCSQEDAAVPQEAKRG